LVEGHGYEITGADVWAAYQHTMRAAERHGSVAETAARVNALVARDAPGGFVARILGSVIRVLAGARIASTTARLRP
jgi:hypothetical protein